MLFVQSFIDLKKVDPIINLSFNKSIKFFVGLIVFDIFLQITFGLRTSFTIHHYIRLIGIFFALYFTYYIIFYQKNKLYKFIILGTLFLLLGALFSVITRVIGGMRISLWGGALILLKTESAQLYMYGMKVGLLLEMICFAFGLSYKNSQQWENLTQLNKQVIAQKSLIQKITIQANGKRKQDEFLKKIQSILEKNLANTNFGTQELAQQLFISRSQLYQQFKRKTQQAPSDFIRHYRLEKARHLILTSDLTIAEIAHRTGFKEAAHFSKSFKILFQKSPSNLRLQR